MLYAIGAGDSILATTDHADYPEPAKQIPRIGGFYGFSLEKLLALKPDLVVVWGGGNRQQDIDKMRQLGLRLHDSTPKKLEDVANELRTLGKLTGHEAQANKLADELERKLAKLRADNAIKPPVTVFYQMWSQPLMTVANQSWIAQIISACNGANVFANTASDYPQVSLENVLIKAPQVILQSEDSGNVQRVDWQQWPDIPAVANNQIYPLNADLLHRAGPRVIDGVAATCDALDKARKAYRQ
ncbi:MAG: cobalamin-binding protein [Shewanella sp.]|nr:cobalamin-binding protein [Shewanella sp.]MCF1458100.1 cobalamin-binding protein [Shewanella sp.]